MRLLKRGQLLSLCAFWGLTLVHGASALSQDTLPTDTTEASATSDSTDAEASAPADAAPADSTPPTPESESDVRPSSFQDVTPGVTTLPELQQRLGEPQEQQTADGETTYVYQVGPFAKVEFLIEDQLVHSIVIHLEQQTAPDAIAEELGLSAFRAVQLTTDNGETLGEVFPERGVLLAYAAQSSPPKVAQLILEAISAESFMLRAQSADPHWFARRLADLDVVIELEPDYAEAHWLRANILLQTGDKPEAALAAAREAVRLDPTDQRYVLTLVEALAANRQAEEGTRKVNVIMSQDDLSDVQRARAEFLLGELAAAGNNHDYQLALEKHLAAIKLATALASDQNAATRRAAKQTLIDAHLAIVNDIVRGNWNAKAETAAKWLRNASDLADGFIENDGGDPALRLVLWRSTLETYAVLGGAGAAAGRAYDAAHQLGKELLAKYDDPGYQEFVQAELLRVAVATVRMEQGNGQFEVALQHAEQAAAFIAAMPEAPAANSRLGYCAGKLYFYVGAIHAVHRKAHAEAVLWYERALPLLTDETAEAAAYPSIHGERFVSMGVSYWETGVKNEALELTQRGLELLKQASASGSATDAELAVPYKNLATMYRSLGRDDEAQEFAARAAQLEQRPTGPTRR